jgi:NADH-ubiquinone oxidoreductase chain 2
MLISSVLFLLSSNAVTQRRDKSILYARIVITILVCSFVLCLNSFYVELHDKGLGLFGGLYHTTALTQMFHIFIILVTGLILQLSGFYPRKLWTKNFSSLYKLIFYKLIYFNDLILNKMSEQFRIIEYPLIILFVVIGGVFLISSCDLISIFLSIELQSYGLYILCAVYRNSERATSGGLTYFLLGGLSSCFILLASSLLYGNSGNTSFDGLYVINNISNINESFNTNIETSLDSLYESYYINFSLVIMSIGFLFKVSAAPFHFWSPDVYDAIPTVVTTFVAIFAKISIFVLLLELVHYTTNFFASQPQTDYISSSDEQNTLFNFSWTFTLLVSSLLSLVIGAVLGLTQFRIKRLYAYSTISHVGFILLALTVNSIESIQSFIFYLMQYSLSNLNAFIILLSIGYSLYLHVEKTPNQLAINLEQEKENPVLESEIKDVDNSPIQLINQIKGYFYINPVLALSLAITLFSFVGIPPLVGFFAKQMILSSALDNGYVFMALIAILASVVSAYYYLAIVKQIFFHETDYILNPVLKDITIRSSIINKANNSRVENIAINIENIKLSSSLTTTISSLTLIILFFILIPQEWLNTANILALILFNC